MREIKIQQICCEFKKDEYIREGNKFIKGNTISSYTDDYIIEEYDDCWVVLSPIREVIGKVIRVNTENLLSHFTHHQANNTVIDILYNKMGHKVEFMGSSACSMEAYLFNKMPTIKTRFVLYNVKIWS